MSESVVLYHLPEICGYGMTFAVDGFRLIYTVIALIMWTMAAVFSKEYMEHHKNKGRYYLFLFLTFLATVGVFLSADLFTTFIFFEIMSFTSYVWVAQEETPEALRAAGTYLAVAVFGGLVMLMGIFLLWHECGTLEYGALREIIGSLMGSGASEGAAVLTGSAVTGTAAVTGNVTAGCSKTILYAAGVCLLVGFGAKAGAFPLHIWLPKAHPAAPAPASALLSGILTKTGIFGILAITGSLFLHDLAWGKLILALGVVTMFTGALLAVFSIDLKRTLACSSMSQIGFILVGIGMQCLLGEENALAVHGTLLHMVNHSMIKLVLFLAAGVVFMNVHALDLNTIRGFGRKKPLLKVIFLIGALAIGGVPFFGGYISKTLLHESIVEFGGGLLMKGVEVIFLFSGGLTVAYMTKLFVAVFVETNADAQVQKKYDEQKNYMNTASTFALAGSAVLLLIWGLFPHQIMDRVAELGQGFMYLEEFGHEVHYFSMTNLSGALISIVIGAVVYLLFIRRVLMKQEVCINENEKRTTECSAVNVNAEKNKEVQHNAGKAGYVNAWPAWLDLEELIYRPVLLRLLPFICGVICRIFDSALDLIIVGLRKSIYCDSELPHELPEGNWFTLTAGKVMNWVQKIANVTWRRKNPARKDYRHILAVKFTEFEENNTIIGRTLSFGLLLFCVGLCLTLVYILWW